MAEMERFCLDTDFLVDFLRNEPHAVEFIREKRFSAYLAMTCISLFELYRGAYKSHRPEKNLKAAEGLLSRFALLNLSRDSVKLAAEVITRLEKSGNMIELRDLFIGTIAKVNNLALKTGNLKDFSRIEGLKIA